MQTITVKTKDEYGDTLTLTFDTPKDEQDAIGIIIENEAFGVGQYYFSKRQIQNIAGIMLVVAGIIPTEDGAEEKKHDTKN